MGGLQLKRMLWPSFTIARAIMGSIFIHWGMLMVVGLKLDGMSVPSSGILGGFVDLSCDFNVETDTLLKLQWYKNDGEFFRYSPGTKEPSSIATFAQPGVHVDVGESLKVDHNRVKIRIKKLDFNSGGIYRCEITASQSFRTLFLEGNLSIIALPDLPKPVLVGFPQIVQYGDKISGNCTFADSYPAAEITLYLNNAKITNSSEMLELIRYKPIQNEQRFTSAVGINKFRMTPKHFQIGGILQIKCIANLVDQRWEAIWNITHQNFQQPFQTAGQNRYSGVGCCSLFSLPLILITLVTTALLQNELGTLLNC